MIKTNMLTIKTLVENTSSKPNIMAEWGLSILVDTGKKKVLFDTGSGYPQVLLHNMDVNGISVTDIDVLVISHGHQDHTGGLRPFFERLHSISPDKTLEVICHPGALDTQYIKDIGGFGCPYTQEELTRLGARFRTITEPYAIDDDIYVSGTIPMTNGYESTGMIFFRKQGSRYASSDTPVNKDELGFNPAGEVFVQDTEVIDDMCLILNTDLGAIVFLGCGHRGMINSIDYAKSILKSDNVYMVIGGTHLTGATDVRMNETLRALDDAKVQKVGVSHCTGQVSAAKLYNALGRDRFFFNLAGSVLRFTNGKLETKEF
ncbi:MAG: MBL fold metallo-hydrolase [Clostridia bacterium]|jgi:7,8-dihydropterin-6-yl-methyl-4-(beta-D-ribofuranosyl)aminobenzene 5'-phosphate synthase|nr:MBL fold metallo-hydrolase [Clostridia bacterium]